MQLSTSLTSLLAGTFLSACAAISPGARYVPPTPGTTYVQEFNDSGSYGKGRSEAPGTVVTREWNGAPMIGFQTAQNTLLMSPSGAFHAQLSPSGTATTVWEPPLAWEYPLEVGKQWSKAHKVKMPGSNREVPLEIRQVVEAYEDVTVPAGTFKAYRIRTTDNLGNENVQWLAPKTGMLVKTSLRRTEKSPQGPGTREAELKEYRAK